MECIIDNGYNVLHPRRPFDWSKLERPLDIMQCTRRNQNTDLRQRWTDGFGGGPWPLEWIPVHGDFVLQGNISMLFNEEKRVVW